jgi:hypothetical protein
MPQARSQRLVHVAGACRTRQPTARRQRNALVPCVGHRTTKRRVRLGTVVIRAATLCGARQNQAGFRAIRVGTAARNRRDAGRWFADVIVRATQWTMADAAEGPGRLSLCIARCPIRTNHYWPRHEDGYNNQHSEPRPSRLAALRSRFGFHSCGSSKSPGTGRGAGSISGAGGSGGPAGSPCVGAPPAEGSRRISQPPPNAR